MLNSYSIFLMLLYFLQYQLRNNIYNLGNLRDDRYLGQIFVDFLKFYVSTFKPTTIPPKLSKYIIYIQNQPNDILDQETINYIVSYLLIVDDK